MRSTPLLRTITLALAIAFVTVAVALASPISAAQAASSAAPQQPEQQAPPMGPTGPTLPASPENITPGELNRLFEAYALLQAQNMLRLTDEQYAEFIVRLKVLQNARRKHQQTRFRLIQDLRRLTAPQNTTTDEAAIRTTLDALGREDATSAEAIKKAFEQIDEVLDIRQRARFRVFEEQLERQKLDLLSRVRRPARNKARPPGSEPGS